MTSGYSCCAGFQELVDSEIIPLDYYPREREWALQRIQVAKGKTTEWREGRGAQSIFFCPSCGTNLPESLRDPLWEELEKLGLEHSLSDPAALPEQFRSDAWWKERGL